MPWPPGGRGIRGEHSGIGRIGATSKTAADQTWRSETRAWIDLPVLGAGLAGGGQVRLTPNEFETISGEHEPNLQATRRLRSNVANEHKRLRIIR